MATSKTMRFSDFSICKPEEILILDNPGVQENINGFTVYDGEGTLAFRVPDNESKLSTGQRNTLQDILNNARLVVGLSVNADLNILGKEGFYLYDDVACIDLITTISYLVRQQQVDKKKLKTNSLKGMIQYFGIEEVCKENESGWAKYKIFDLLSQFKKGFLNVVPPKIICKARPKAGEKWIELTKEGVVRMEAPAEAPAAVESVVEYQGFYEVLLPEEGDYIIVRMTASEYRLFTEIQKCRADFTVKMFYETILKPGIVQRLLGEL